METAIILLVGAAIAFAAAGLINGDKRLNGLAALAAIATAALWTYDALLPEPSAPPPETVALQPATPKPEPKAEPVPIPPSPAPKPASKKQIYDRIGESGEIAAE